jgi:FkbM family methyltransferase
MSRVGEGLRRHALLAEDIVPYDVHRFDRRTWVIKETQLGVRIWCSLDDRAISRAVLVDSYDLSEMRFIEKTLRPGDLAVDAGANIGYYALHFAKLVGEGGHVEALEPLGYLADALSASVVENDFGSRVTVHRTALDERPDTVRVRHAPRTANFGGAHFAPETSPESFQVDETITTVRLDDVIGDRTCSFLKVDVEGAEPRVIRGARNTLATSRPVILAELHDDQLRVVSGSSADDFIAQMSALGYCCSRLNPDGTRGHALNRYADKTPINVVFDPEPTSLYHS